MGNVSARATSELLRGIPSQKEDSLGATNPMPAQVTRSNGVPRNGHDLARDMRKRTSEVEKIQWLAGIPPDAFASIFRVEIDAELLQTIVSVMFAACSSECAEQRTDSVVACSRVLVALAQHCP